MLSWSGQWRSGDSADIGVRFVNLHDLAFVEPYERHLPGRLAVNPVFDLIAVLVRLSALIARFAKRQKHLIFVHPRDGPLLLNGLLDGLRQLLDVLFSRRVLFEIEDR